MAKTYSKEMQDIVDGKQVAFVNFGATLRCIRATITLSAQAIGDEIFLAHLPEGAQFKYGIMTTSVSLGTSTIEIGTEGDADKYRTSGVFTTANVPTMFGLPADIVPVGGEDVILKPGTAALPESGTLIIDLFYTTNQ